MRLSRTARYALRAAVRLARNGDERIPAGELSRELDLPENYLSKTLHVLAREGVLDSIRGPGGGYRLDSPPEEITLLDVLEPFETIDANRECVLGRKQCSEENPCPVHGEWKRVADRVAAFFRETTLAEVVGDSPTGPLDALPTDAAGDEPDN